MYKSVLASTAGICVLCVTFWLFIHGFEGALLLRNPHRIEAAILEELPLGSSVVKVREYIKDEGFRLLSASSETGFLSPRGEEIGSGHLYARMGGYWIPITRTDVCVYFGFDDLDCLMSIDVRKFKEGL